MPFVAYNQLLIPLLLQFALAEGKLDSSPPTVLIQPKDAEISREERMAAIERTNAFLAALRKNDHARVRESLRQGVDVNRISVHSGQTPLALAAMWGDVGMIELLLDAGADVKGTCKSGVTALHQAFDNTNKEQRWKIVMRLLEAGADPNAEAIFQSVFGDAITRSAPIEVFRAILEAGLDLNPEGVPPLVAAGGRDDVLELLLAAGARAQATTSQGRTALMAAAQNPIGLKRLLAAGADVHARSATGSTALMVAAADSPEGVRLLLAAGAKVNEVDHEKKSPLFHAAASESPHAAEIVRVLLEAGADVDSKDSRGLTPFLVAAWHGLNPSVLKLLKDGGADTEARDAYGNSALGLVVRALFRPVNNFTVLFLLQQRLDPKSANAAGWTPLMEAARFAPADVVRMLASAGDPSEINRRNNDGETPLLIAIAATDPDAYLRWICTQQLFPEGRTNDDDRRMVAGMFNEWAMVSQADRVWALLQFGADPDLASNDGTSVDSLLEKRDDSGARLIRAMIDLYRQKKLRPFDFENQ